MWLAGGRSRLQWAHAPLVWETRLRIFGMRLLLDVFLSGVQAFGIWSEAAHLFMNVWCTRLVLCTSYARFWAGSRSQVAMLAYNSGNAVAFVGVYAACWSFDNVPKVQLMNLRWLFVSLCFELVTDVIRRHIFW